METFECNQLKNQFRCKGRASGVNSWLTCAASHTDDTPSLGRACVTIAPARTSSLSSSGDLPSRVSMVPIMGKHSTLYIFQRAQIQVPALCGRGHQFRLPEIIHLIHIVHHKATELAQLQVFFPLPFILLRLQASRLQSAILQHLQALVLGLTPCQLKSLQERQYRAESVWSAGHLSVLAAKLSSSLAWSFERGSSVPVPAKTCPYRGSATQ
jgi:hypothetical protein